MRVEAVYPMLTLEQTDSLWLWLEHEGVSRRSIARRCKLSVRTIQLGIMRAKSREAAVRPARRPKPPRLLPLFGCQPYTPQSVCPHYGPIPEGDHVCCMVCHRTGIEYHPALRRDPRTDPPREPKRPAPVAWPQARETRKQRRARLFARAVKDATAYLESVSGSGLAAAENG